MLQSWSSPQLLFTAVCCANFQPLQTLHLSLIFFVQKSYYHPIKTVAIASSEHVVGMVSVQTTKIKAQPHSCHLPNVVSLMSVQNLWLSLILLLSTKSTATCLFTNSNGFAASVPPSQLILYAMLSLLQIFKALKLLI